MKPVDFRRLRLLSHHLLRNNFSRPQEVVSYYGAVQAQDYAAAKWSVSLRMRMGTDAEIEKSYNEGSILRTHIMRPTWHLVTPAIIRSLLMLTSPRVQARNANRYRNLELDAGLLLRCHAIFRHALSRQVLTRQEMSGILLNHGITASGQRLAYILMHAELEGILCSGPRKGKQFTYALLDERVPEKPVMKRDEALARLAFIYFTSHGPARPADFAWWSGLSMQDASDGISMVESKLIRDKFDGSEYFYSDDTGPYQRHDDSALLLSIFDEYIIAYKNRDMLGKQFVKRLFSMGNALTTAMVQNGQIIGTWKRDIRKTSVVLILSPLRQLSAAEKDSFRLACQRYGKFLNYDIGINYSTPSLK